MISVLNKKGQITSYRKYPHFVSFIITKGQSPLAKFTAVEEEKSSSTVAVPEVGAELDNFFQSSEKVTVKSEELDVSVDDFNELFLNANDM